MPTDQYFVKYTNTEENFNLRSLIFGRSNKIVVSIRTSMFILFISLLQEKRSCMENFQEEESGSKTDFFLNRHFHSQILFNSSQINSSF